MTRWGVGPKLALISCCYGCIVLALNLMFPKVFRIEFVPENFLQFLGIAMVVAGILFLFISAKAVMRAYNSDELVTTGIFAICRNPMYASWILFIVPGLCFIYNRGLCLTLPVFMYYILRHLIVKEEAYLVGRFGDKYIEYKKKVPFLIPFTK